MKIFVLTLLFTFVMFLDSVQSMEQSTPRRRAGGPPQPFQMKRYDMICRGSSYIGQYVEDVKCVFKITAPGKFVLSGGKPVPLHPQELQSGDLLIRSNLKWAVFRQGWLHELPEAEKKELSSELKFVPKSEPVDDVPLSRPPFSSRHFLERTLPLDRPQSSTSLPPPAEPILRDRSRSPSPEESPAGRNIFSTILGFRIEDLGLIRLVPNSNQNRIFELRRYTFPADKPIQLRAGGGGLEPIPNGRQIVVSAPNGDVFAIVEKSHRHTVLRGIYTPHIEPVTYKSGKRAKINMNSGAVEELTTEEAVECPLGMRYKIAKSFRVYRM